jgi:hypothetical protein
MTEANDDVQPQPSFADQLADLRPQRQNPRMILNLPNLRVRRIFVRRTLPQYVEFAARIENDGIRDSGPFDALTFVTRDGQQQSPTTTRIENLPGLTGQLLTLIGIDGEEGAVENICVRVWLDPPTADHPGGEVLEANNLDNLSWWECFDIQFPPSI